MACSPLDLQAAALPAACTAGPMRLAGERAPGAAPLVLFELEDSSALARVPGTLIFLGRAAPPRSGDLLLSWR